MDFIFNMQSIMDMFCMVKVSLLIELVKIFCASHYSGTKSWWVVSQNHGEIMLTMDLACTVSFR
jgi:hypothetical protein